MDGRTRRVEPVGDLDDRYSIADTPSTVGFGDISATSQSARLVVTFQMLLDPVILGVGINAFVSAPRLGRKRQSATEEAGRTG
jgi:voltage-gated potassium channel